MVALGGHDGFTRLRSAEIYDPGSEAKTFSYLLLFMLDLDYF